jgi:trehalose 6-phosphate phosphatase
VAESSRRTDVSLERALSLASDALAEEPAGILTDFDGTLSPIVADPSLARLVEGAEAALTTLAVRLGVVAVITGRASLDARRMTGVPGLLIAGNHGTEWLDPRAVAPEPSPGAERVRRLLAGALGRLPRLPGVSVEDKGLSATVHYRLAADPAGARLRILEALGELPDGVEARDGRMSVELRPVGLGDKGAATRAIIERFGLRGVVVMGDDVTDLDMFAAVAEARAAGRLRGAIIAVGAADGEVPPAVAAASDVVLADVHASAALIAGLAR